MDAGAATASAPEVTDITAADQGGFAAGGPAGAQGGAAAAQQAPSLPSAPPPLKAAPALYYVTEPEAEPMDAENEEGGPDIDVQELPSVGGFAQQPDAPAARAADGTTAKRPPRSPRADGGSGSGGGGGADAGAGARDEQLLRQRRAVLRVSRSRSASVDSACEGDVTEERPLASPGLRVHRPASPLAPGDGEGAPTTPQKRQLSAAAEAEEGGAPSSQDTGHAAKRPAPGDAEDSAASSGGDGGTVSRSPSRPPLASVFAQPHVQAVIPPGEMHLPGPDEMLPPPPREAGSQGTASQQQQQGSPSPSPPPGVRQQPTAAQQLLQQQLQQQGSQRVWSSGSLPPAFAEAVPSAASLQGWLSIGANGSPLAGSPLKRGGHGGEGSGSGSFRKWIKSENSCGSFTLPFGSSSSVPASLEVEDSLAMDIQLLPPVVPEEVPPEEEGEEAVAAAEARQWERQQAWKVEQERQRQMGMHAAAVAASIAASERAFHAKIAMWEDELLGMLQTQMAPVTIRAVVQAFKDRIVTERDKAEFKALCDKYTVVVEYPVNSGVKCLALKAWLQEPEVEEQPAGSPAPARAAAAAAAPAGAPS